MGEGMRMTREAFQKLIDENLAWLRELPQSPERDHIDIIVRQCVDHYYPPEPAGGPGGER